MNLEKLSAKCEISESGCWLWMGKIDGHGYPELRINGQSRKAHRVAWQLARGEIPRNGCIRQRCGSKTCIRPEHLEIVGKCSWKARTWTVETIESESTREPDGCWEWRAHRNSDGYGVARRGGRLTGVHRISWELHRGQIPRGAQVLHSCDNPPCVNPAHLFLGTHVDNMADRQRKGRTPRGSTRAQAKITEADIEAAFAMAFVDNLEPLDIAKRLGLKSGGAVCHILDAKLWQHVSVACLFAMRMAGLERPRRDKLNAEKVREIRRLRAAGEKMPAIAMAVGSSAGAVSAVLSGVTWSHVSHDDHPVSAAGPLSDPSRRAS